MTADIGTRSHCITTVDGKECGRGVVMMAEGWAHLAAPHEYPPHYALSYYDASCLWTPSETLREDVVVTLMLAGYTREKIEQMSVEQLLVAFNTYQESAPSTEEPPGFDEGARWVKRRLNIPLEADGLPAHGRIAESVLGVATPNEVRITNEKTGGQKGSKDAKYHLIPAGPLKELAELYGFGAKKYAPRNWELGYDWSLSFDAMMRHGWGFWNGEDVDPETRKKHLASVVFHAFVLMQFMDEHPELDDRPHTLKEKNNAEEA